MRLQATVRMTVRNAMKITPDSGGPTWPFGLGLDLHLKAAGQGDNPHCHSLTIVATVYDGLRIVATV